MVVAMAILLVGNIGGWAATTTLSNAVVGEATVVIDDNVKKIQHLVGGIVSEISVSEGSHVNAGEILLKLDGTSVKANLGIINSNLAQLYVRRSRLEAERLGQPSFSMDELQAKGVDLEGNKLLIDGELQLFKTRQSSMVGRKKQLEEKMAQLDEEIKGDTIQLQAIDDATTLVNEELAATEELYEKKLVTMQKINSLKRQKADLDGSRGSRVAYRAQAEGKIAEIKLQVLQLDADQSAENSKDLTDVEGNIAEMEERRIAALDQLQRLDLKAPLSGRIYQLSVHTLGGVVTPGETLMLLAPDNRALTVEAKIATRNIDQVHVDQDVDIRFTAFDQRSTPEVQGKVLSVSPDAITEERTGAKYYPVRIRPEPESLAKLQGMKLYPGMPAEIFIKVADRSVISYLTKPLTDQMKHTFREE
ncbi:HlyD family type I secretion periplasmic adaptor subunit [Rhizobium sp. CF142]|uniref:HlyD family type I secretion periplasmic adaptor subunit n=1 Tax=Rhizobium sp. CF142 TaxID=1144314 RepID=UPI0002FF90CF|nr:HlyD family type I secretion periplasmic adaptor subunit [Rhizobium sp. CF142]